MLATSYASHNSSRKKLSLYIYVAFIISSELVYNETVILEV